MLKSGEQVDFNLRHLPASLPTVLLVGLLIGIGKPWLGVAAATAPVVVATVGRRSVVYSALLGVLALTVVFGRDFTYLHAGIFYVLEATLILVAVLLLPDLITAIRRIGPASVAGVAIVALTAVGIWRSGVSAETLRQGVLGLYSAWAAVGAALAFNGRSTQFARVAYWASIPSGAIFALSMWAPDNAVTGRLAPIPVASSIYLAMGVLIVLFAPSICPARWFVKPVFISQLALIAAGEVRSVWVALPFAVIGTALVSGLSPTARWRVLTYPVVSGVCLLVAAGVAFPSALGRLEAEGRSIYNYNGGSSVSDANARWRLTMWRYGAHEIAAHPLVGVGFRGEEVPPTACGTACNVPNQGDPTLGPGAALHNSILAVGLRLGIPGLLLFIICTLAALRAAHRGVSGEDRDVVRWLCAVMLLVLLSSGSAVVLEGPYMGVFFWFTCGMLLAHGAYGEQHWRSHTDVAESFSFTEAVRY